MRTAIIVYSFSGNNFHLATHLQNRLAADLFVIDEKRRKSGLSIFLDIAFKWTPSIKAPFHIDGEYDHYMFVAPVWDGRIASPMRAFLQREAEQILGHYSFATVCGGSFPAQRKELENELNSIIGRHPEEILELSITDLLPGRDINKKLVEEYRINEQDLQTFRPDINHFTAQIRAAEHEILHYAR